LAADRFLIDTSVWIEYLNDPRYQHGEALKHLMETGRAFIAGLVLAELIQGARAKQDLEAIEIIAAATVVLDSPLKVWKETGSLSRRLRQKGLTLPLQDCLLAVLAVENGLKLLSHDRHFQLIEKSYPLELARL